MAEEVIEQNELEETEESVQARKELLIFWLRMFGWLAASVVAPITVFSIKFGLFTDYGYQVTTDELGNVTGMRVALNGWGIVSILLIFLAAYSILNEVIDAYSKQYSFTKQILVGIKTKLIPIFAVVGICYFLRGVMDQVIFCLLIIGICQIAAVPLNPLPKWKAEKKGEEDYSDLLTLLPQYLRRKLKKDKEEDEK